MIKAVIDLGTNTFNLLVAEVRDGKLKPIHSERSPVMLGMGGINLGYITEDAFQRAIDALKIFKERAFNLGAESIQGYGTAAIREASNGQELIDFVKNELDIEILMISGKLEGELIYKGVGLTFDFPEQAVIMDIGGGSTEFVLADREGMIDIVSLNIGVSRIYQHLKKPLDYSMEEIRSIQDFVKEKSGLQLDNIKAKTLVGASGTFETFYEMAYKRPFPMDGRAHEIEIELLKGELYWTIHSSFKERDENPWVIEMRKRMLPVGAAKISWVIEKLGIEKVYVSPYSLKEGAFIA